MENDERRRTPRVRADVRVDYGSPDEVILDHELDNLSLGGACLGVVSTQPVGARIVLFITIPGARQETIEIAGEVVWANDTEPKDIGIRFLEMSDQARETLRRYISDRLEKSQGI